MAETEATIISPGPIPLGPLPSSPTTRLTFRWKAPNKVTVTGYSSVNALTGRKATWRFDGKLWYDPAGRSSQENTKHRGMQYQVNMMYRVAVDRLMANRAPAFYSSFDAADRSPAHPEFCVLRAHRLEARIFAYESSSSCADCLPPPTDIRLPDELYFDAKSGLLRKWQMHEGWVSPGYVQFEFDDYRQAGTIKIPFYVHVEFGILKATFNYSRIDHNLPLKDSLFASRKHCTTLLCDLLGLNPQ